MSQTWSFLKNNQEYYNTTLIWKLHCRYSRFRVESGEIPLEKYLLFISVESLLSFFRWVAGTFTVPVFPIMKHGFMPFDMNLIFFSLMTIQYLNLFHYSVCLSQSIRLAWSSSSARARLQFVSNLNHMARITT